MNASPRTLATTLALAMALVVAGSASGLSSSQGDRPVELEATPRGHELGVDAAAWRGTTFGVDRLQVRVSTDLPDGTVLLVAIDRGRGYEDVGSARIQLGAAVFALDSSTQPNNPAFPVAEVRAVSVSLRDSILAEGRF